jgi:hypothetical protein
MMKHAFLGQVRLRGMGQSTPASTPTNPIVPASGAGQPTQISQEQLQQLLQQQAAQGGGGYSPATMPQNQAGGPAYLVQHGALVEVMISAPDSVVSAMKAQGQTPPPPQKVVLMVDTGASISGIRDSVATAAGLTATGSVQVGGVAGTQNSAIYAAKFALPKYNIDFDAVQVAGFQLPGQQDIDGLLGRDLLEKLTLVYSGPSGEFQFQAAPGEGGSVLSTVAAGGIVLAAFGSLFWLATGAR